MCNSFLSAVCHRIDSQTLPTAFYFSSLEKLRIYFIPKSRNYLSAAPFILAASHVLVPFFQVAPFLSLLVFSSVPRVEVQGGTKPAQPPLLRQTGLTRKIRLHNFPLGLALFPTASILRFFPLVFGILFVLNDQHSQHRDRREDNILKELLKSIVSASDIFCFF